MINFPKWVHGKRSDGDAVVAARRLRYMVMRASIQLTESGSISSFADFTGVDRALVHWSMRTGSFSVPSATKIEAAVGPDLIKKEWLIFPLDVKSE